MLRKFPSAAARAKYVCRRARVPGRKLTTARDRNSVLEKAIARPMIDFAVSLSINFPLPGRGEHLFHVCDADHWLMQHRNLC